MVFGILLAGSAQASSWTDLWYRPRSTGSACPSGGRLEACGRAFRGPAPPSLCRASVRAVCRRRSNGLQPFTDAGSQYNRGNALAKSGDLQGALNAYDGTLKHADLESSLRRDAQHNRDLVARQLQTQKDQQRSSSGQKPLAQGAGGRQATRERIQGRPAALRNPRTPPATAGSPERSQGEDNKPEWSTPSGSTPPMTALVALVAGPSESG